MTSTLDPMLAARSRDARAGGASAGARPGRSAAAATPATLRALALASFDPDAQLDPEEMDALRAAPPPRPAAPLASARGAACAALANHAGTALAIAAAAGAVVGWLIKRR